MPQSQSMPCIAGHRSPPPLAIQDDVLFPLSKEPLLSPHFPSETDAESMRVAVGSLKSRHSTSFYELYGHRPRASTVSSTTYESPPQIPETSIMKTQQLDVRSPTFLDFMAADHRLAQAVKRVEQHSKELEAQSSPRSHPSPPNRPQQHSRNVSFGTRRRRYQSLLGRARAPIEEEPELPNAAGNTQRRAWINTILQPNPRLPDPNASPPYPGAGTQEDVEEHALVASIEARRALQQASDDVRVGQNDLLAALSAWTETSDFPERLLSFAQAVSCQKLAAQLDIELQLKEGSSALDALQTASNHLCDTLEEVRESSRDWQFAVEAGRDDEAVLSPLQQQPASQRLRKVSAAATADRRKSMSDMVMFPTQEDFPSLRSPTSPPRKRTSRSSDNSQVLQAQLLFNLNYWQEARLEFVSTL